MFYPTTLPDEIHIGYLGRIASFNGIPPQRLNAVLDLIRSDPKLEALAGKRMHMIELLAFSANMSTIDFVRKHTLLPYRRAIASHKPSLRHGDPTDSQMIKLSGGRVARPGAYFCINCIKEDLTQYGMSYWKRTHQLPGIYVCPTHRVALRYSESQSAFSDAPSDCISNCHIIDKGWALESHRNVAVRKFLRLSSFYANAEYPLPVIRVRSVFVYRAREHGLPITKSDSAKFTLSDLILTTFPKQWLEAIFPGISTKEHGQMLNQIDGVLYLSTCASTTAAYLLAICVLFDSVDQAISALASTGDDMNKLELRRTKTPKLEIEKLKLFKEYVSSRGVYSAIAEQSQTTLSLVSNQLRELGLPDLKPSRNAHGNLINALHNFFVRGLPMTDSAVHANVHLIDLERAVRQSGSQLTIALKKMLQKPIRKTDAPLGKNQPLHLMNISNQASDTSV